MESKGMETPSLSIVVPTFDRPHYLRNCLESLVNQTSRDFEVVVVANGALESSYTVIDEFKVLLPALKVVRIDENIWSWEDLSVFLRGVYKAGLDASSGEFILFLSDDNALSEEFVERVLRIFASNPECVGVTGSCINRDLVTGREYRSLNVQDAMQRPVLEDGKSLALRALSSNQADRGDLSDPGFGYVIKTSLYRDEEVQESIWMGYEDKQIQFLLPQGLVGFDFEATYYWGRHPEQSNKVLNKRIGMLRFYLPPQRLGQARSLQFWNSRFGPDSAERLNKIYREERFPRSLRLIWQDSSYVLHAIVDIRQITRHPRAIKEVFKTDAREVVFWIVMPQALWILFVRIFRRGGKALRDGIRSGDK
jgi:glycosyltransferase involved in cell wall biosynthesis